MEFDTYFTRTHIFGKDLTPKNCLTCLLHVISITCSWEKKKKVLLIFHPNIIQYTPSYQSFPQFSSIGQTNFMKIWLNISTRGEYTTNNVCSKLYFTQKSKILQGQCRCVREKFHVCTCPSFSSYASPCSSPYLYTCPTCSSPSSRNPRNPSYFPTFLYFRLSLL